MSYIDIANKHEKEIFRFLKKLGFKDVNGGSDFFMGGCQVDACAGYEKTLLIIECTTQKDINSKVTFFRGKVGDIIYGFKSDDRYKKYRYFIPIVAVKHQIVNDNNKRHAFDSKARKIYLWDNNFIIYYLNLQKSIDNFAIYSLLSEINVKPEHSENITLPALSISVGAQGRSKLFLFFIEARKLLKFSYVARRELGDESFYQRMIKKERLKKITEDYIQKNKRIFPNSIVVALEEKSWKYEPNKQIDFPNWLELGYLTLYNNFQTCWIIDGQHRLYSYARTTVPGILAVSAFAKISQEMQADYFLDINREAKPVDPNLLWDLTGTLSKKSTKGIISNSIKGLFDIKDGFFKNNIKILSKGRGKRKYNFNNLCVSLEKNNLAEEELGRLYNKVRNPFWDKDWRKFEQNLTKGLNHYFNIFNSGVKEEKRIQLYTDGFISVLIVLFKFLVIYLRKSPNDIDIKSFFKPVWAYINELDEDDIQKIKKNLSSEAGKLDFRNDLIRNIRARYREDFAEGVLKKEGPTLIEKIKNLEYRLNEMVNSVIEKEIGPNWMENPKYFADGAQRKKCLEKARRKQRPPWEFLNLTTTINSIVLSSELWGRFFKEIFITKDHFQNKDMLIVFTNILWEYRSDIDAHPKLSPIVYTKDQKNIIQSAYNIFNTIIETKNLE